MCKIIDLESFGRKDHFCYFKNYENPFINVATELETKNFIPYCRGKKISHFDFIFYCLCHAVFNTPEFMTRIRGDNIVIHDTLYPSCPVMGANGVFNLATFEFIDDIDEFAKRSAKAGENAKTEKKLQGRDPAVDNYLYAAYIPWGTPLSVHFPYRSSRDFSIPVIGWSKYKKSGKSLKINFYIQVHHSLVDGIHIHQMTKKLKARINSYCSP
ncbi:MAG: hypothetical protein JXA66_07590 [Oligoflexia bacterium]|nr:hypothetical protein [Oligoflexia bacterium]